MISLGTGGVSFQPEPNNSAGGGGEGTQPRCKTCRSLHQVLEYGGEFVRAVTEADPARDTIRRALPMVEMVADLAGWDCPFYDDCRFRTSH